MKMGSLIDLSSIEVALRDEQIVRNQHIIQKYPSKKCHLKKTDT